MSRPKASKTSSHAVSQVGRAREIKSSTRQKNGPAHAEWDRANGKKTDALPLARETCFSDGVLRRRPNVLRRRMGVLRRHRPKAAERYNWERISARCY